MSVCGVHVHEGGGAIQKWTFVDMGGALNVHVLWMTARDTGGGE